MSRLERGKPNFKQLDFLMMGDEYSKFGSRMSATSEISAVKFGTLPEVGGRSRL